jgi:phage FluMu protein Com
MQKLINIRCPYCNIVNRFSLSEGDHLIWCELEDNGCNELFAVVIKFRPECKVFKLVDATTEEFTNETD